MKATKKATKTFLATKDTKFTEYFFYFVFFVTLTRIIREGADFAPSTA